MGDTMWYKVHSCLEEHRAVLDWIIQLMQTCFQRLDHKKYPAYGPVNKWHTLAQWAGYEITPLPGDISMKSGYLFVTKDE